VTEPKPPAPMKLRDWPMFQTSPDNRKHRRKAAALDGRPLPRIAELLMSRLKGPPAAQLAWLQTQKSAGRLDGDDPEEIREAEALLAMLTRLAAAKAHKEQKHVDELLDEALKDTFPASDPVSVGHFTGTERG
jgi:hypothetical protein